MRKPRPEAFDPDHKKTKSPTPEQVDMAGVIGIEPRENIDEPKNKTTSYHETMLPSNHATTVSRYQDDIIEIVRKAVKVFGKEAATYRFTQDEKRAIADLVYSYKRQGNRTSENEFTRIAVNFLLEDHKQNGANSILDRVLKALNE